VNTPQQISAPELQQRLLQGESLQLVDVREEEELQLARLSHPVLHLALSQSSRWLPGLEHQLERDRPVVVLCHAGIRSWQFCCWLIEHQGYRDVWNLRGGIEAWSVEVDPSVPRY
jgi:rhodanese-related sulfurtransferase